MLRQPPAGLIDLQRRERAIQLVAKADWYLVEAGVFEVVGSGDVSAADMDRVHAELGAAGVFVCVAKARELDELLPRWMRTTRRRITQADRLGAPIPPKLNWVARGARVAVLPEFGTVWVDDEHLFRPGELVPLPWTDPLVELTVVRPAAVLVAMRDILGPGGPKRAKLRET